MIGLDKNFPNVAVKFVSLAKDTRRIDYQNAQIILLFVVVVIRRYFEKDLGK
jgi:hypothetical protein